MSVQHRIAAAAASVGLVACALVVPAASAIAAPSEAPASGSAVREAFGPYRSAGECNYWRRAVQASGRPVSLCFPSPPGTNQWYFTAA
jgi:hypothetical protein